MNDSERMAVPRRVEWTATDASPKPDVSFIPMMERRRLSLLERAALHVAWRLFHGDDGGLKLLDVGVPVVFASRWGEIGTTFRLVRQMYDEGEMSPAGFSASVHNAAPGAWSLFTGNHAPYTAIAARARTYEMGLMEAKSQLSAGVPRVLYVYAEESTPEYYLPEFGTPVAPYAVAMLFEKED